MDVLLALAEDVPGPRLLELRDRADVAGAELVDRQQVLAEQAAELTDPLLLAAAALSTWESERIVPRKTRKRLIRPA